MAGLGSYVFFISMGVVCCGDRAVIVTGSCDTTAGSLVYDLFTPVDKKKFLSINIQN